MPRAPINSENYFSLLESDGMMSDPQEQTSASSLPMKPGIDIHKIPCPRCRFKVKNEDEGDIETKICKHCLQYFKRVDKYKHQILQKREEEKQVTKPPNVSSDIELSTNYQQPTTTLGKIIPDAPLPTITPLFDLPSHEREKAGTEKIPLQEKKQVQEKKKQEKFPEHEKMAKQEKMPAQEKMTGDSLGRRHFKPNRPISGFVYALSDPKYIHNGWTVLPQLKWIQKVNIYSTRPSQPECDWFKQNQHRGVIFHEDTCEKMAEIHDNGCGRWYYNNGELAMDYYECEEKNVRKRYVVYSKSETGSRDSKPGSVLAMFDSQGNGIVYDEHGNIRIKYTQSEGVVMDRTIDPYCTWKWHNLNDPPVLQEIMTDNLSPFPDPYISSLDPKDVKIRESDEEMLAIEFDNFIKERSKKLKQKYQKFKIKTKTLKINDQFVLKIIDQEHIYLKFIEGCTNIKINIGVTLNPNEILESDNRDVGTVTSSLERRPARSRSLQDLQTNMKQFRRHQQHLDDYAKRVRDPVLSADKLIVGVSKPLRLPILAVKSETKTYKDEQPRFACQMNLNGTLLSDCCK